VDDGEEEGGDAVLTADEDRLVVGEVLRQLEEGLQRLQELGMGERELAVLRHHVGAVDALADEQVVELLHRPGADPAGEAAALFVDLGVTHDDPSVGGCGQERPIVPQAAALPQSRQIR